MRQKKIKINLIFFTLSIAYCIWQFFFGKDCIWHFNTTTCKNNYKLRTILKMKAVPIKPTCTNT
jgi:hypothetical protein